MFLGAFSAIRKAYDESTDAAKSVEASDKTVDKSEATRDDTMDLRNQVQPGNIQDLEKLDRLLASRPDLTPTAKQVGLYYPVVVFLFPSIWCEDRADINNTSVIDTIHSRIHYACRFTITWGRI